jgi:glycosyltransferase involved in cell wall biosynthesis
MDNMFSSTIIPTVGRHTLTRAVNSVVSQNFDRDNFEVIVVNDSGKPLPWDEWQSSSRVQVINTNRRERSIARNTGAAIARGKYLHFLDDDDWLFPGALNHFWVLSQNKQAAWYYGSTQLVERDGSELIQLHHGIQGNCFLWAMAGEWIPLQSSLIEAGLFHRLGGFSPLLTGPEDIDLLRRVCLYGEIAGTPNLIAYVERGDAGSTTDYNRHPEVSRLAREKILDQPGVFPRMRAGADSSFWLGKLLRIYLTSAVWNLRQKQFSAVGSRFMLGLRVILHSGLKTLSKGFWNGFSKPYESPTFARGIELSDRFGS